MVEDSGPGCHPLTTAWRCEPAAVTPIKVLGCRAWARANLVWSRARALLAQLKPCRPEDPVLLRAASTLTGPRPFRDDLRKLR